MRRGSQKSQLTVDRSPLAWGSRPSHVETLSERRITAARNKPLEVVRFEDATAFDRLYGARLITYRQHEAAQIIYTLAAAGGLLRRVTGSPQVVLDELVPQFDPPPERGVRDLEAPSPRDKYRAIMRRLAPGYQMLVDNLVQGDPTPVCRLATLGAALDALGDLLGLRR